MAAVVKKPYILGAGGKHTRNIDGKAVRFVPGDTLWLTDEEAAGETLKGRLTLTSNEGKIVRVGDDAGGQVLARLRSPGAQSAKEPAPRAKAAEAETAAPAAAAATPAVNYDEFVASATAESLVTYIENSTADEIRQLRDAEKGRGKVKRIKVINAANAALRRLNMAKARAARDAKKIERDAASAQE